MNEDEVREPDSPPDVREAQPEVPAKPQEPPTEPHDIWAWE